MTDREVGLSRRELLVGGSTFLGAAALGVLGPSAFALASSDRPEEFDSAVATGWFDLALTLVRATPGFTPPVASRALGYAGVTLYESVVPGSRRYRSLEGALPGLRGLPRGHGHLHWPAVANAAMATILRSLFPTTGAENLAAIDNLESAFAEGFRAQLSRSRWRDSVQRGREVAGRMFDWSRGDGGHEGYLRNFPADYVPPVGSDLWVPTPPGFQRALQPFWGTNRCMAITDGGTCPPGDHTSYSEDPDSAFFVEAVEVYEVMRNAIAEQVAIARFWSDDPGATATPAGHSISIATQVLRNEDTTLMAAAETYARVGIAVCDAFIACWSTKFRYNLLRPVTYIQRLIDPGWLPLLTTPPFPEYTSGHSVQSGAAFAVLADLWGDDYSFDDHTHDNRGLAPRHFDSFTQAANEAAISRLYGGIHFRPAIELGVEQGRCVALAVNALAMRR